MAAVVAEKEPHSPDRRCGSRSGSARYPSMSSMSFRRQAIRVTVSATHIWDASSATSPNSTCVFKSLIKFDGNLFFNRQRRMFLVWRLDARGSWQALTEGTKKGPRTRAPAVPPEYGERSELIRSGTL